MTTYEEWRVTGTLPSGKPYEFIWSLTSCNGDSEAAAREQVARATSLGTWVDGPYLHNWEEA